ncbi:MAG: PAS domain S-box protein [Limisphaerales bacterium]
MTNPSTNGIIPADDFFRPLVEQSIDGVLLIDAEGVVQFANPAAKALFADKTSQLVGFCLGVPAAQGPVEMILPGRHGIRHAEMRVAQIAWKGRTAHLASLRDITQSEQVAVALQAALADKDQLLTEAERMRLMQLSLLEDEKEAAATLANERSLLRSLVDLLPDAIFVKDRESRFILANAACAAKMGVASPQDLLGKTDADFYPAKDAADWRAEEIRIMDGIPVQNEDEVVILPDGTEQVFQISKVPLRDTSGKVTGLVGSARDITERIQAEAALRASEQRFRTLVEQAPDAVFIQAGNRFVYLNPAALILFGGQHPEELLGQPVMERLHPDFQQIVHERIRQLNELRQPVPRIEETYLRLDGSPVPVEVVAVPFNHQGQAGALVFVRDVTERNRLAQEREAMEAQMRQQQKLESIGTLASGVAHEINNPVNGIMNYAQLIQDRLPAGSPLGEYASEILHETQRVTAIVRNLLTFARSDKQSHSRARIADIVEATLSLIRTVIRHDQITLTVDVPTDLPEVICRSQQIQQVIMNLMTNARDALNERYPGHAPDKLMLVSAHSLEKEGRRWIRVTVEDHGNGILPAIRARMFDPFFTTKPRDRGTGLGLSISHGIVKEHAGQLWFETELGKGTRFHVDLPAVEVQ